MPAIDIFAVVPRREILATGICTLVSNRNMTPAREPSVRVTLIAARLSGAFGIVTFPCQTPSRDWAIVRREKTGDNNRTRTMRLFMWPHSTQRNFHLGLRSTVNYITYYFRRARRLQANTGSHKDSNDSGIYKIAPALSRRVCLSWREQPFPPTVRRRLTLK